MDEIHLSDEDRAFVEAEVRAGRYSSVEDVVRAGLSLLEEQQVRRRKLKTLAVAAEADIAAGRFHEYENLDDLIADLEELTVEATH
ncbi:antitoxin ParD1/3/4 [Rhizobium sp. RU20A]|uniref:type II toxin-antitoxin system ParD family antitoxin n=1 Tax=Rhizobium sp. RU20A TaxID=1907412 RepID=UPI000956D0E5|nr:type II toxin-antitoxin system ParD family antitoxin [Rhizobium sp. RU20A]SIP93175.1 antitoxin ParD1/3/4 [Rhizobium sp. RU20A]